MLSSQCTFDAMVYFDGIFLSRNGEESFSKLLSPDPDHPRGGASYRDNTPWVKKLMSIGRIAFQLRDRTDIGGLQTNRPKKLMLPC